MAALKETIMKNSLVIARHAAARFPEHKDIIDKFLSTFHKQEGEPDPVFGYTKYKALMRKVANRRSETIFIDLDDVEEFVTAQLALSGEGAQATASLEALQTFVPNIENNAKRYTKYFFDACVDQLPERDADFNDNQAAAKDNIQQWRKRMSELNQQEGAAVQESPIPRRLEADFDVHFRPRSTAETRKLREVGSKDVGHLIRMDCLVVRASSVKPKVDVVTYHCEVCKSEIFQVVDGERYTPPKECPSQKCRENKKPGQLSCILRSSKFIKYQEVKVQEMSEHVPVGGVPRSMNLTLQNELTRRCSPGDAVQITGVYVPAEKTPLQMRLKSTAQEMYLEVHSIKKHKMGYTDAMENEELLNAQIDEEVKRGDLYERCAKSIAPEIFGHVDVKNALLCALLGSYTKTLDDGLKIRGDIHTLFMGDPGVAKSQLMKQACNIAPRSVYTTGKGSSGVGLTAAVVRDPRTSEVTLEGGALVLADQGICCIDEFDKMEEGDRTAIHEVMEQQTVSIAKAGITTTLNSRTTVLAAANPVYGRYNPYKSPVENIDLPPALLSRFDLLFLLLDTVDADKDRMLALHVTKVHSTAPDGKTESDGNDRTQKESRDIQGMDLDFKPISTTLMRAIIRKARTFEPLIPDDVAKNMADIYVQLRKDEASGDMDSRKDYTTPRRLLALARLAIAFARIRFSKMVDQSDLEEAMRLLRASKESVELASPVSKGAKPLDVVYEIIKDLSGKADAAANGGWLDVAYIVSMAGHKAMSHEQVQEAIDQWVSLNILVQNPAGDQVKFSVAAM